MDRKRGIFVVAMALPFLIWTSCATGPSTGGTIETENLTLVLSVDSVIPAGRKSNWPAVVATLRFDSTNFDFHKVAPDGRDLRVERMDGTRIPFAIRKWDSARHWARVQVRFEGELLSGGRQFRVRTEATSNSQSDSTAVWRSIPDSLRSSWTSVLVDDFEGTGLRTLLPNAAIWHTNKADSATITPPVLVDAGGGRSGKALRYEYRAPASRHDFVLVGTVLATHPVNFRSLDSIVFWARGVAIQSVSLDNLWNGGSSKTWMHADLDTVWTRWRVTPQNFDPPGTTAGNVGWASVHDSVTNLSIFATAPATSGWVMLDDIRFYGMEQDDFK